MAAGFYLFLSLPLILSCLFFAFPSVYSVNFEISRFEHSDDLILFQGEARPTNGIIDFNTVDNLYRVGWATYANSTRFAFSIDTQDASDYGHGFVFFFAPAGSQLPLNLAVGRLGLFNTSQWVSRLGQVVMVKFDTYKNGWDPAHLDNHVGITNNSIIIHNGDTTDVLITYNATTRNLSASWSYRTTHNPQEVSSLSYLIDLKMALPEWVMIGFSVATGVSTEQHILQWWEFNSTLERDMENGGNISTNVKIVLGFGAVYRGYLPDLDVVVAVKRISRGSKQGKKEYITEVKIISQLRHRNLVQLIGWCHDEGEFLLVYEFMPNGSLDFHLFGNKTPLSWVVRYRISLGLASAILYRHEEWEQYVVHRDIKSNNIMLDSSFNVKLGDFGLARLMDHELGPKTTSLAGTLGYLASEYVNIGRAMVLLEIATGRKSVHRIQDFEMGLVVWVWDLYGQEKLLSAVDEKLNNNVDEKQVDRLMIVGLWCAHPDNSSRPSIKQGTQALNFEIEKPNIPTKMPIATYVEPYKISQYFRQTYIN
ncbi:hypothetical protein ES288_A11G238000v1 [Gossypium darwinii]|uniref:Protein kinase domain-containing protein n=1 Tax=Gossypium darwinii TaxID=34276 RepID=A0A5D2EN35_GOSDA|nr:hypothetical protein ES288_A11G238000v1 [Gossypium darwinii]